MRLEILVEEVSMKTFLEGIIDKIIQSENWKLNENIFIRAFEGKSHLQKEICNKAKVYKNFHEPVTMVIIHDQDSSDCRILKTKIEKLILPSGFHNYKIRIVCRELENWYLGDFDALEKVIPEIKAKNLRNKSIYRNPEIPNGKDELKKIKSDYGAIGFANEISRYINIDNNRASSFNHTIGILQNILRN